MAGATALVAVGTTQAWAVAPAASADADMGVQAVGCDPDTKVRLNAQTREGRFVDAVGGFYNCDSPPTVAFTIKVQLKNGIFWSDKVPRSVRQPVNTSAITTFTCTGQGRKTYRAQMTGYRNSGDLWVRNSANITVYCP
ncbi:hypothetical protein GKQ77_09980 [Streptomyces sp. BG9H]|uniref:Uncharacterized protein n=1 Tax=Streptomyces anatolicus TaxID=2675858 RepID=A0ABS6YKD8_9ACTN|nr:hypothetical protein [Streptomyces anatolicus]MBW5421893.1 hypothetical protein [Streptomyces anatolicus]